MDIGVISKAQLAYLQKIDGFSAQRLGKESETRSTHIKVTIHWCQTMLQWQVVAAWPATPGAGPDIICPNEEHFHPLVPNSKEDTSRSQQLRSQLLQWDPKREAALHELLRSMVALFREEQLQKLQAVKNDRLQFELSTLPHSPGLELLYIDDRPKKACFAIPLEALDLSALAPSLPSDSPSTPPQLPDPSSGFKLEAEFQLDAMESPIITLRVPRCLQGLLPPVQLPSWSRQSCFMEFIPLVTEKVQKQVDGLAAALKLREELVDALQSHLGHLLEFNPVKGCAMWQVAWESSLLLLYVDMGPRFPEDKPIITLQSLKHMGGPGSQVVVKGMPWSPRWDAADMASRLVAYLRGALPAIINALPI